MIPYEFDAERFSKWMAYVLRHNPTRYGLQPDRHGFVNLAEFVEVAKRRYSEVDESRVRDFVQANANTRFEVTGDRLRARYGHSFPADPVGPALQPPETLYYGIEAASVGVALRDGLAPSDRQSLHLSVSLEDALAIAQRKTQEAAVLRVAASQAHSAGIAFYREGAVYLTKRIPPEFLAAETLTQQPSSGNPTPDGPPSSEN